MEPDIRLLGIIEYVIGYIVTLAVTVFYGVAASWYKNPAGRYIFILLLSITLVLTNSMIRIIFPSQLWTSYVGLGLFAFYILAMFSLGVGIYNAQIRRYYLDRIAAGKSTLDVLAQLKESNEHDDS